MIHAWCAIHFQVAHSYSVYLKRVRWPFWPHTARIMVVLLKTPLTTVTLKGRRGCPLRAGSMPAKSTMGCVRECERRWRPTNFCWLITCGPDQRGARMILDASTVVLAITETKLYWRYSEWQRIDAIVLPVIDCFWVRQGVFLAD